ncbi:MAG: glycine betaine ABC transporter substrate-binding protein [Escherichia sp.]
MSNELKPGKMWSGCRCRSPHCRAIKMPIPTAEWHELTSGQYHAYRSNKAWAEKNPAAAKLFAIMQLPVADINAQNAIMHDGKASEGDIQGHVDGWIKAHQQQFDGWVNEALAAQK